MSALADALRQCGQRLTDGGEYSQEDFRNTRDLLRVLANLVDGMPMRKAFGAPGDWGYDTPIGRALARHQFTA